MAKCTFTNGITSVWGAIDSVKEGQKNRRRLVVRRHEYTENNYDEDGSKWHELFYYHFHKGAWSDRATRNREMIKAAQRTAHDIERGALHPEQSTAEMAEEGLRWKERYAAYRRSAQFADKPYHFYNYIYVTILREIQSSTDGRR